MLLVLARLRATFSYKRFNMTVENRYMRSDQETVNSTIFYKLLTTESASLVEILTYYQMGGSPVCYYGIRVWKRSAAGVETEITAGNAVAVVSCPAGGSGSFTIGATWTCPLTDLDPTDRIVVRVYADNSNPPTTLRAEYITEALGADTLDNALWTVYYRVRRLRFYDPDTELYTYWFYFRFGISGDDSYIENFSWTPPVVAAAQPQGDGITFVI